MKKLKVLQFFLGRDKSVSQFVHKIHSHTWFVGKQVRKTLLDVWLGKQIHMETTLKMWHIFTPLNSFCSAGKANSARWAFLINTVMDSYKLNIIETLNCFSRLQGPKWLIFFPQWHPSPRSMYIKSMPVFLLHVWFMSDVNGHMNM